MESNRSLQVGAFHRFERDATNRRGHSRRSGYDRRPTNNDSLSAGSNRGSRPADRLTASEPSGHQLVGLRLEMDSRLARCSRLGRIIRIRII